MSSDDFVLLNIRDSSPVLHFRKLALRWEFSQQPKIPVTTTEFEMKIPSLLLWNTAPSLKTCSFFMSSPHFLLLYWKGITQNKANWKPAYLHWIYLHSATRYLWATPGIARTIKNPVLVCQYLIFWGRTRWSHAADSPRPVTMHNYEDCPPLDPRDKGYSPSSQDASFLRFSCLSSSWWACSSWDAVTDRNATAAILGSAPTGISRAFSDAFSSSCRQTHVSVVKPHHQGLAYKPP